MSLIISLCILSPLKNLKRLYLKVNLLMMRNMILIIIICKEIMAKQVKQWPKKDKPSTSKLSVKYVVLHRIGDASWVLINHTSIIVTGLGCLQEHMSQTLL